MGNVQDGGVFTMADYAALDKRPQYFGFFLEACESLSLLEDAEAGHVIKAIADYFIDGETPEGLPNFTKNERRTYNRIKRKVDESCGIWYAKVQGGKKGGDARWGNSCPIG